MNIRKKIIKLLDDGILDKDDVISACLNYMSLDEITEMAYDNDLLDDFDDEEQEHFIDGDEDDSSEDEEDSREDEF